MKTILMYRKEFFTKTKINKSEDSKNVLANNFSFFLQENIECSRNQLREFWVSICLKLFALENQLIKLINYCLCLKAALYIVYFFSHLQMSSVLAFVSLKTTKLSLSAGVEIAKKWFIKKDIKAKKSFFCEVKKILVSFLRDIIQKWFRAKMFPVWPW